MGTNRFERLFLLKLQFLESFVFAHLPRLQFVEERRETLLRDPPLDDLLRHLRVRSKCWSEAVRVLLKVRVLGDPAQSLNLEFFVRKHLFVPLMYREHGSLTITQLAPIQDFLGLTQRLHLCPVLLELFLTSLDRLQLAKLNRLRLLVQTTQQPLVVVAPSLFHWRRACVHFDTGSHLVALGHAPEQVLLNALLFLRVNQIEVNLRLPPFEALNFLLHCGD